jgi:hypothetical protein
MASENKYEMDVADYRNYELTVFGQGNKWESWIRQGKHNLTKSVETETSRESAKQVAAKHLVNFLSKNERKHYKPDDLSWRSRDAETKKWLAGNRSK